MSNKDFYDYLVDSGDITYRMNEGHQNGSGQIGGVDPVSLLTSPVVLSAIGATVARIGAKLGPKLKDKIVAFARNRGKDFKKNEYKKFYTLTKYTPWFSKNAFKSKSKFTEFIIEARNNISEKYPNDIPSEGVTIPFRILTKYFDNIAQLKNEDLYQQLLIKMIDDIKKQEKRQNN